MNTTNVYYFVIHLLKSKSFSAQKLFWCQWCTITKGAISNGRQIQGTGEEIQSEDFLKSEIEFEVKFEPLDT